MTDDKSPAWSRAKVGKNKVYWVVVDDTFWTRPQTIGEGYAATFEEAEQAALECARQAGVGAKKDDAQSAAYYHSQLAKARRAAKGAKGSTTQVREYLYTRSSYGDCDYYTADGQFIRHDRTPYPHLILKKTAKKIFVTSPSGGDEHAIVLDRAVLERDRYIYSTRYCLSAFYLTADEAMGNVYGSAGMPLFPEFEALELSGKVTLEDVKAAYRAKAMECHPDRGGNADDFPRLETAYREAMRHFAA